MNQGRFKTEQTSGLSVQDVLEYSRKDDGALFSVKENMETPAALRIGGHGRLVTARLF
jgi:hypothetical protein